MIHFTLGKTKNLQKIKHSPNFEASVEAKNTETKVISILPILQILSILSGKNIKIHFLGRKMLAILLNTLQVTPQFYAKYKILLGYISDESFINISFVVLVL